MPEQQQQPIILRKAAEPTEPTEPTEQTTETNRGGSYFRRAATELYGRLRYPTTTNKVVLAAAGAGAAVLLATGAVLGAKTGNPPTPDNIEEIIKSADLMGKK